MSDRPSCQPAYTNELSDLLPSPSTSASTSGSNPASLPTLKPTFVLPARITTVHPQLRDLIVCPQERGTICYVKSRGLGEMRIQVGTRGRETAVVRDRGQEGDSKQEEEDIPPKFKTSTLSTLKFTPNCLAASSSFLAAGGQYGELHLTSLPPLDASTALDSTPHTPWSLTTTLPRTSINNSLLILPPYKNAQGRFCPLPTRANSPCLFDAEGESVGRVGDLRDPDSRGHPVGETSPSLGTRGLGIATGPNTLPASPRVRDRRDRDRARDRNHLPTYSYASHARHDASPSPELEERGESSRSMSSARMRREPGRRLINGRVEYIEPPVNLPEEYAERPYRVGTYVADRTPPVRSYFAPRSRDHSPERTRVITPPLRSPRSRTPEFTRAYLPTSPPRYQAHDGGTLDNFDFTPVTDSGDEAYPWRTAGDGTEDEEGDEVDLAEDEEFWAAVRETASGMALEEEEEVYRRDEQARVRVGSPEYERRARLEGFSARELSGSRINESARRARASNRAAQRQRLPIVVSSAGSTSTRLSVPPHPYRRLSKTPPPCSAERCPTHGYAGSASVTDGARLLISNNDHSIKMFALREPWMRTGASPLEHLTPSGSHKLSNIGRTWLNTAVNHSSVSPDGKQMLVVGDTTSVYVYNILGGGEGFTRVGEYKGSSDAGFSTSWSKDGRKFAVASQDGQVTVWDHRSSQPLAKLYTSPVVSRSSPSFAGDLSTYWDQLDAGGYIDNYSRTAAAGNVRRDPARVVKFSPEGSDRDILVFSEEHDNIHIVDARTFDAVLTLPVPYEVPLAGSNAVPLPSERPRRGTDGGRIGIAGICFDPTGNFVYSGTESTIVEWDLKLNRKRGSGSSAIA